MIVLKTKEEIEKMQKSADILVNIHRAIRDMIRPGITTMEIEEFVKDYLAKNNAKAEQIGYMGYEYAICASVNDEICHGFPRNKALEEGDLVTIDMVVSQDGWMADSAWSYAVGQVSDQVARLMEVTKESLYRGIEQAQVGNRLGDIGYAIQSFVEEEGYSVVRDFVGHGIGKKMHEDPQVLHYGSPGRGMRLEAGMTITIEPMVNTGDYKLTIDEDGWTARTKDGGLSCQYEHTIVISPEGPIVLTEQGPGY